MKLSDMPFYTLKKGMEFNHEFKQIKMVLIEDIVSDYSGDSVRYEIHDYYGLTGSGYLTLVNMNDMTEYVLKEEDEIFKPTCWHYNTKKVILINTSGYLLCKDCGADIRSLTDDELMQAVKEQYGGKECKRAPEKRK